MNKLAQSIDGMIQIGENWSALYSIYPTQLGLGLNPDLSTLRAMTNLTSQGMAALSS